MTKLDKIKSFDPNGIGALNGNLFGLPFSLEESEVVVIPVPWEVTVSFSEGTASAINTILESSPQLDLFDPELAEAWKNGISMLPISEEWKTLNDSLREKSKKYIFDLESGKKPNLSTLEEINNANLKLKQWVKDTSLYYINLGKKVCLLGGDHSTPLGFFEAISESKESFGILQIDAHCDLRDAYEGFEQSHASIMFNALKIKNLTHLTQVGIRDYCDSEVEIINSDSRVNTFFDKELKENEYKGVNWEQQCNKIIETLPQNVHISFDIDGLDPKLCPNTGTPVPSGLEMEQVFYLFKKLVESKKKIISFDLVEVGNDDWDANVGARVLYRLCNLMIKSQL